MKRTIIKYLFLFAGVLSLNSCYDLDTAPYEQISSSTFWKTEEHAKQAIMGVYRQAKQQYVFGTAFMFDNMGDIGIGYDAQSYQEAFLGSYNDRSVIVVNHWKMTYDGVQRANTVIRNVATMTISEEVKTQVIAEAKFMRALYYFHLLDFFGGVPLYDESVDLNADFNNLLNLRSSEDDVRAFILKDLDAAIQGLPVSWSTDNYGRATKGAAYALRGKVYLYHKEWQKAVADFEEIVYNKTNSYGYQLYDNYADLFNQKGHASSEMIFAIQNKGGVGIDNGMPFAFYIGTRSTYGSCWNNGMPSAALADMYELKDGKKFNWNDFIPRFNEDNAVKSKAFLATHTNGVLTSVPDTALLASIYAKRDPRMLQTLIVPYSTYLGWNANKERQMLFVVAPGTNENFGQIRNNKGWYTYLWRKFVPEGDLNGELTNREHTPFNFPIIRLADVLLMLSEAYNELGQLDKAVVELNKVRQRSSTNMPALNSGSEWLKVTTKEEMFERIMHERAVELACEGHRFSDLKRWGLAKSMLNNVVEKSLIGANLYTRKFDDRDYLWPIPGQEIETNDLLTQNPGWY
ncbi:RagB/SusD family nutrient uptake outer membrane protein [Parabacteroides sp. Marseille-P3160]|uniref:RagB/SusD family nutrient uptake outer membrane protein n=1 Tax=Parabacteroides sp. Marseille-P3160 TaxID=1917887 RepID=UPI0009BB11E4|nr:RagB/SusD family nutrient uptake outer membrane protein [Parabacteroides sp. Marseille-P3160]